MSQLAFTRRRFLGSVTGVAVLPWFKPGAEAAEAASPGPQLLLRSMEAAGRHLTNMIRPDDWVPYWRMEVTPENSAHLGMMWPAHNLGRFLDAQLRLEAVSDYRLPKAVEAGVVGSFRRFFDNPDHLCLNPDPTDWFELHSIREWLLGLTALIQYRGDTWAAGQGGKLIEILDRAWRDDGTWDFSVFAASQRARHCPRHFDPVGSAGRAIEALLLFHQETGDSAAMALAERWAHYHFACATREDGTLNRSAKPDHNHSYHNTLQGLLRFGRVTGNPAYLRRIAATYAVASRRLIYASGWAHHDLGDDDAA